MLQKKTELTHKMIFSIAIFGDYHFRYLFVYWQMKKQLYLNWNQIKEKSCDRTKWILIWIRRIFSAAVSRRNFPEKSGGCLVIHFQYWRAKKQNQPTPANRNVQADVKCDKQDYPE